MPAPRAAGTRARRAEFRQPPAGRPERRLMAPARSAPPARRPPAFRAAARSRADARSKARIAGLRNEGSGSLLEISCDGRGVERRRHHDNPQIRPLGALQAAQQGQRQIGFQMPLVKFVQDHGVHAGEQRIGDQAAREDAFGEKSKPRSRTGHFFEANLIADRFAQASRQAPALRGAPPIARPDDAAPAPALVRALRPAARAERAWFSRRRAALRLLNWASEEAARELTARGRRWGASRFVEAIIGRVQLRLVRRRVGGVSWDRPRRT